MAISRAQSNNAAAALQRIADNSENLGNNAAKALTDLAANAIKKGGELVPGAVEVAGGVWVAKNSFENVINALGGEDVWGFKASTSNTDKALAVGVYTAATLVASGMALHGAFSIASKLAEGFGKEDESVKS